MSARPTRWRAMFEVQWKWTRYGVLLSVLLAFTLPLLSFHVAAGSPDIRNFISAMQAWSVGYAVLSAGIGLLIALAAWANDHRQRHVYPLSLPIARWRYVLFRFGNGLVLLLLPTAALFIAAQLVAHGGHVPAGLRAYPVALTLRFAFASVVAYAIFFAVSSATGRTAGYILGAIAAVLLVQIVLSATGSQANVIGRVADIVFAAPGLLAVFGGRWLLIDV
jgi:FtsH-binding integral membrane protein